MTMTAPITRAAEMLSTLSDSSRVAVLAELSRRGGDGANLTDLGSALGLPAKTIGAAVARLYALGVVVRVGDAYCARLAEFRDVAAALDEANPVNALLEEYPRLKGVFSHGRLVSLPEVSVHGRDLAEMCGRIVAIDRPVDEAEVNRRLAAISDDVAFLRRLMVDEGVLTRDPAGSVYEPRETEASGQRGA
jgi:DNA-binding transcriptional ArsR family regulator